MSFMKTKILVAIIAIGSFLIAQPVLAEESGSFKAVSIQTYDYVSMDFNGTKLQTGHLEGTQLIIESTGGPFVVGEYGEMKCLLYAKGDGENLNLEAPCEVTSPEGDKLFILASRKGATTEGSAGSGVFTFSGGTGKFANLKEVSCTYTVKYLPNNLAGVEYSCEWTRE